MSFTYGSGPINNSRNLGTSKTDWRLGGERICFSVYSIQWPGRGWILWGQGVCRDQQKRLSWWGHRVRWQGVRQRRGGKCSSPGWLGRTHGRRRAKNNPSSRLLAGPHFLSPGCRRMEHVNRIVNITGVIIKDLMAWIQMHQIRVGVSYQEE